MMLLSGSERQRVRSKWQPVVVQWKGAGSTCRCVGLRFYLVSVSNWGSLQASCRRSSHSPLHSDPVLDSSPRSRRPGSDCGAQKMWPECNSRHAAQAGLGGLHDLSQAAWTTRQDSHIS